MNTPTDGNDLAGKVASALSQKKPWMLSSLARECQVSEKDVARALPPDMCAFTDGENFTRVWEALCAWEKATFIVQHEGHVIEVACRISAGRPGHGYYNIMGEGVLGGHIRACAITDIAFLSMPFMGLESYSVQFFHGDGRVAFAVYAGEGALPEAQKGSCGLKGRVLLILFNQEMKHEDTHCLFLPYRQHEESGGGHSRRPARL